jgi:hypothetical protein
VRQVLIADDSARGRIERLRSGLIAVDSAERPVENPGLVRTYLFCVGHELPADRLAALRDHSLARDAPAYFIQDLMGPDRYVFTGEPAVESTFPLAEDGLPLSPHEVVKREGWERQPVQRWWRGRWDRDCLPDHSAFMEYVLLDGAGTWAIVFSLEDSGFLIADPRTSQELLDAWHITASTDLEESEAFELPHGDLDQHRILDHARAGLWA